MSGPADSAVRVVLLLPDVLGTYGDAGNADVLTMRLRWRGYAAETVRIGWGDPVPAQGDVYVLGGGEDAAQVLAARHLVADRGLRTAIERGTPTLAVCAGLQILGDRFTTSDGITTDGLGMLDLTTRPGGGPRHIGDVLADPLLAGVPGPLEGFENHGGATTLGPGVTPLARVRSGIGNGTGGRDEGAVSGRVVGTYLHGPVLARNAGLADLLLSWVVGGDAGRPLDPPPAPAGVPAETAATLRTRAA